MAGKKVTMTSELQHWHKKRKSFNTRQVGTLTDQIQDICAITPWGKYIYLDIQHSVAVCLAGNSITLKANSKRFQKFKACIKANRINTDDDLKAHFAQIHAAKMIQTYKKRCFINPSFRENLKLLIKLLKSDYPWESPIAFMIPRDPNFVADGDSSLFAAGGFSTQLQLWWHLEWPEEIQARNIKETKKIKTESLFQLMF
eukprot:1864344-Ditylum_brightwellii.AAC.1